MRTIYPEYMYSCVDERGEVKIQTNDYGFALHVNMMSGYEIRQNLQNGMYKVIKKIENQRRLEL